MADQYAYYNQIYPNQDRKINRVYINPNFSRPENIPISFSNNMYLNPNFSHVTPNIYNHKVQEPKDQSSKARIHVNPNFIRNANIYNHTVVNNPGPAIIKPALTMPSSLIHSTSTELNQEAKNSQVSRPVTKSRYSFVRQKENIVNKTPISRPVTNTVRVNKYKSVSISDVKHNLATIKPSKSINDSFSPNAKYKQNCKPIQVHNNRYKFVKSNTSTLLNQSEIKHVAVRRSSLLNKSILKTTSCKLNNRLVLKKNNIPCPLYKKYGKCLRKIQGNCEYLHDKKHVSICRKFLKGICHDNNCLLSHDLTDKKMPTCYFFLQGACTKENCPYLHVKLNDKTKICHDFLKGYCEKGDKCLFRHINICQDSCAKEASSNKPFSPTSKINVMKVKSRKRSLVMVHRNTRKKVEDGPDNEQRYFKEFVEDKSSGQISDMIKPSRIKLGILPSFIQL